MFKKVFRLTLILAILITTYDTLDIPKVIAEETQLEQELLMWQVNSKPGSIYNVYILGSYHLGKKCKLRSQSFERLFKDSENVVFEVDLSQNLGSQFKLQQKITNLIREKGVPSTPQESLKNILDAETYQLLERKAKQQNIPLHNLSRLKPWVFMFVYFSTQLQEISHKAECGLDSMILKKAEAENKKIIGLETIDYQLEKFIDLYVSMDLEEIKQNLKLIIETDSSELIADSISDELNKIISNIDAGNLAYIESYINNWCNDNIEDCESMLLVRNRNWIPEIEKLIHQKQDSLIVVGAGHLVGEQSVIQLLEKKGYNIKRITRTNP